jgi:hypothetical protein
VREKIILLVAGCLIGVFAMGVLPVQAHHGDDLRRLKNRVAALEKKTVKLNPENGNYTGSIHGRNVWTNACSPGTAAWETFSVAGWLRLEC